jgi:hypothetical protein
MKSLPEHVAGILLTLRLEKTNFPPLLTLTKSAWGVKINSWSPEHEVVRAKPWPNSTGPELIEIFDASVVAKSEEIATKAISSRGFRGRARLFPGGRYESSTVTP